MALFDSCVPTSDFNGDSGVTIDDLLIFLDEFDRGC